MTRRQMVIAKFYHDRQKALNAEIERYKDKELDEAKPPRQSLYWRKKHGKTDEPKDPRV